jgi:nitroimidazol reductase NimA-like FMN-containing flavoprotein (pyridoxamine 5'-phosphate oxidase superfamily)
MGRAQELQLQAQDREAARKTALELAKQFRENKAGESGVTEKPDAGV